MIDTPFKLGMTFLLWALASTACAITFILLSALVLEIWRGLKDRRKL
jgi:hypothetical protein